MDQEIAPGLEKMPLEGKEEENLAKTSVNNGLIRNSEYPSAERLDQKNYLT